MTCHSSSVPITPMSAGQCRSRWCRDPGGGTIRRRRSRIISARIEAITHATPETMTASLRAVGLVMKRVSISIRAERPC